MVNAEMHRGKALVAGGWVRPRPGTPERDIDVILVALATMSILHEARLVGAAVRTVAT